MPIWLRNFTYKKLEEFYEKQQQEYDKRSGKQKLTNNVIKGPNIKQPSYSAKARK